ESRWQGFRFAEVAEARARTELREFLERLGRAAHENQVLRGHPTGEQVLHDQPAELTGSPGNNDLVSHCRLPGRHSGSRERQERRRERDYICGAHDEHHPAATTLVPGKIWHGPALSPDLPV